VAWIAGSVLFSAVGVAYADGSGGWSQFNEMMKQVQSQREAAQAQQAPQKTTERDCRQDSSRADEACRYTGQR
jgi:hypothetical protein